MPVDHRLLLAKYIELVASEEGVTFVSRAGAPDFSPEEFAELREIEAQIFTIVVHAPGSPWRPLGEARQDGSLQTCFLPGVEGQISASCFEGRWRHSYPTAKGEPIVKDRAQADMKRYQAIAAMLSVCQIIVATLAYKSVRASIAALLKVSTGVSGRPVSET